MISIPKPIGQSKNSLVQILTPKEQDLWNDPRVQELIRRFDLQPIKSPAVTQSQSVQSRIDTWFDQFADPNHVEPPRMITYTAPNGVVHQSPF